LIEKQTRGHERFLKELMQISRLEKRKERGKEKIFIEAQPHLFYEHGPHQHKENNALLSMPLWRIDFGNLITLHALPKKH